MFQQGLARRCRLHAVPLAHQQRRADRVFELGQPLADGRADDAGPFAGARDVAGFADADEQAQGGEVEVAQGESFRYSALEAYVFRYF
jgi:hypothetical protein